ncbi:hypothetical protein [Bosea massiliensis]|jgi:hypothetical protein|uniref:WYL domain-containing protein n=1 Tax=Bosea massiliensis TaxID=151419 RepID=A0ABW0P6Q8_9HYPH
MTIEDMRQNALDESEVAALRALGLTDNELHEGPLSDRVRSWAAAYIRATLDDPRTAGDGGHKGVRETLRRKAHAAGADAAADPKATLKVVTALRFDVPMLASHYEAGRYVPEPGTIRAVWRYRYRSAAGGAVAKVAPILDVGGGRSWRAPKWPRLCEDPRVEAVGSTYRLAVACDLVGRPDLLELEGAAVEKRRQIAAIRDIADLDGGAAITVFDLGQDGHWSIQLVATSGNKGSLQLTGIVQELVAILETQALLFARSGKKFVPSKID